MASAQSFGIAYPSERFLSPEHALAVAGLSDDHGKLARTDFDLEIGAQVRIVPNHSCPVANLAREYMVLDGDGIAPWSVDAASNAS